MKAAIANRLARPALALVLFLTLLLASVAGAMAQVEGPLVLTGAEASINAAPHSTALLDRDGSLSLEEAIAADRAGKFEPVTTRVVDFGISPFWHWLKIPVVNASDEPGAWLIAFNRTTFFALDVHIVRENGDASPSLLSLKPADPFEARGNRDIHLAVPFELDANEKAAIFVHFNAGTIEVPVTIDTPNRYETRGDIRELVLFIMLGTTLGIALSSTFSVATVGRAVAISYAAYLLVAVIYNTWFEGYFFKYLWPAEPAWDQQVLDFLPLLGVAFGNHFIRKYLQWGGSGRAINLFLHVIVIGNLFLFCFYFALVFWDLLTFNPFAPVSEWFFLLSCVAPTIAALEDYRRGKRGRLPFFIGCLAISASTLLIFYALYGRTVTVVESLFVYRTALLVEAICFAIAISAHLREMRDQRTKALNSEVRLTREKLALSETLRSVQQDYSSAMQLAEQRRVAMAAAAHDIQQPLTSLRMTMMKLNSATGKEAEIAGAFDYLNGIVSDNLADARPELTAAERVREAASADARSHPAATEDPEAAEDFDIAIVLKNSAAMFRDEARAKGIHIGVVATTRRVHASPLVLMRIVSNLVSNAVKNTQEGRVLIGCRPDGAGTAIEIYDTGPGFAEGEAEKMQEPHQRSGAYQGSGLGLSIVRQLCKEYGFALDFCSVPERGTRVRITVPHARRKRAD